MSGAVAIKFIDAITERPLSVYTDSECTTAYPNPMVLPLDGKVPIYVQGGEYAEKVYGAVWLDYKGREIGRVSPLSGRYFEWIMPWWRRLFI